MAAALPDRAVEIAFESRGERCAGWLHLPDGPGPHPAVVLLHSTAGVRQLHCYARRGEAFAAAGVAALQFDARGFGASAGAPRQLLDVRRLAEDLAAALAFARSHERLDAGRLALWAGSASCGLVLDLAARDEAIRAVVCLTPFVPGRETYRSAGTPLRQLGAASFADRLRVLLGRAPRGVRVGGEGARPPHRPPAILVREDAAARERAMLPPDARLDADGQRAELPGGVVWENRVVLRPRLRTPHPLRLAARVRQPLLVVAGERDVLCPPAPAAQVAERAPAGELASFPTGHFDLYDGASIDAESAFLARALGAPAVGSR
jgi:pimeloyl-ACP methyl ester carboxylesterase